MDSKVVYWSLLNEHDGRQSDGLTFDQAKFIYSVIATGAHENWLGWHEGLPEWKPLETFQELKTPGTQMRQAPSPPNSTKTQTPTQEEEERTTYRPAGTSPVDGRLTKRFVKNYKVEIRGKDGKVFTTVTENVSMGGMLLKDAIPPEFGKSFEVTLVRGTGASIHMFCNLVRLPKGDHASNRVRIIGNNQEGVLRSWLLDPRLD